MKTQTDMALIGLVLVVVAGIALAVWSAGQVDMAAAQVGAQAAAEKLPMAAVIGGQVSGWALKTLIGIAALAIATGMIAWVRQWWKGRNSKRAWRGGPNAQWQSNERGPRVASSDELMRLMLMQQMAANKAGSETRAQRIMPADDKFNINF
jgi:hypothetical protein